MLNMKVTDKEINIAISGSLEDIVTEMLKGIDSVYGKVREADDEAADMFEALLMTGLLTIFKPEDAKEMFEKWAESEIEEADEDDKEILDDIIATLEKIRDVTKK